VQRLPPGITIDGPAASGKSTVGNQVAKHYGWRCIDTGLLYRALARFVFQARIDPRDETACVALANAKEMRTLTRALGKQDTRALFESSREASEQHALSAFLAKASLVASYPLVRAAINQLLREEIALEPVVMIGRDCGTIVFPEAQLKVYLMAHLQERTRRRFLDIYGRDGTSEADAVLFLSLQQSLELRDDLDRRRMLAAPDAMVLSTDLLTPLQVCQSILTLFEQKAKQRSATDVSNDAI
jgi:cytidylate kinase